MVDSVSGATELEYLTEEELPEAYIAAVITAAETSWRVHYDGPVDPTDRLLSGIGTIRRRTPSAAWSRWWWAMTAWWPAHCTPLSREPSLVTITFEEAGFQPEPGKYYLLHGTFYDSKLRGRHRFRPHRVLMRAAIRLPGWRFPAQTTRP